MTTIAQVKQVVQPLLQRNPDLALVGRRVIIKPIHHILRGISIGRSINPALFIPAWAVVFLFEPRDSLSLNWGERIYKVTWDVADPDLPTKMCEAIEEQALPLVRPIKTIDDFVGFATKERFRDTYLDLYEHRKIFVDIARGDLESARSICEYMATDRAKHRYLPLKMDEEYNRITKELCPLIAANDRPGLARLLHKYEEGSVRAMKLEKYWEPTPFPIELES
ncbi:MAG: hypothetical protein GEU95_07675 [Rhizobiales bacterium]|nr:hypothetical protein [Hyphomicrobiales bacterium]